MSESPIQQQSVAIVGGGLAGLSAAAALCERGLKVEFFEARQSLGGRAGSFVDPNTSEMVDHCQHVGMECCTNLHDFFRQTGIDQYFQRYNVLHFFGPDGRRFDFRSSWWLPAPLHLGPALMRLKYLTFSERLVIPRVMLKLARTTGPENTDSPTVGDWLREENQSEQVIERFWSVVLVSALGESIDRASLSAARKVFVDGFMNHRRAYHINVPTIPLGELYEHVSDWLTERGVTIHCGQPIKQLLFDDDRFTRVRLANETTSEFDFVIVAVPWKRLPDLLPEDVDQLLPQRAVATQISSAPITAVHLWFDQPITALPHAVLIGRLSQWLFNHGETTLAGEPATAHNYQVVISASHELSGRDREDVLREVGEDLASIWPLANDANLLHWKVVTQRDAVFSFEPGLDNIRPDQTAPIDNLMLAGDWTKTGWPSTMEGAVRSGRLAAEGVLRKIGRNEKLLVADLPRNWFVRCLI